MPKQPHKVDPIIHNKDLIKDHIQQLADLSEQGEHRGIRLTKLEKKVENDNILIFDKLGIKKKENGKRDKQIREALARISEVKEESEDETKSLKELLVENQIQLAEIKGYIKGQDKREEKHDKEETKIEDKKQQALSRRDKWLIAGFTAIAAPLFVLFIIFIVKTFIWHF